MPYITNSPLLNPEVRSLLIEEEALAISGRPLNIWTPEKEFHYDSCGDVIDMPFFPKLAVVISIPDVGHRHIDRAYRGEFVAVTGTGLVDGYEYRFGVRDELGFSLTRAVLAVTQANALA